MKTEKDTLVEKLIKESASLSIFEFEMNKIGVMVVKPEQNVACVAYSDQRRFFPKINEFDIVTGGFFA